MIVIDTNVVSEMLKPSPDSHVMHWLADRAADVAITSITVAELSAGVEVLPEGRRKTELRILLGGIFDVYRDLVLGFDADDGQCYGTVIATRRALGRPVTAEDAMIAAICVNRGLELATRNTKDFDGLSLDLTNPWVPPN